jgi:hypothetical protein
MHTVYHVAALHEATRRIVAALTPAGWMLPTLVARDDIPMARLFELAGAAVPIPTAPRCVARIALDVAAGSANAVVVLDIGPRHGGVAETAARVAGISSHIAETPSLVAISDLRHRRAVLGWQADTVRWLASQADDEARPAPLHPFWLHDVAAWVAAATGHRIDHVLDSARVLRADEESAVVRFCPAGAPLYFKARVHPPFVEAHASDLIAARIMGLVAPTRVFDPERRWRLADHVDGVPLDARCWPAQLAASDDWLRLQCAMQPDAEELATLGVPHLTSQTLRDGILDALDTVSSETPPTLPSDRVLERVDTLLTSPFVCQAPSMLLHFDAAPRNILWTSRSAVFLDLDSLHLGPGVIAGELMSRRMKGVLADDQRMALAQHSARAWCRAIGRPDLESYLSAIPPLTDVCLLAVRRAQLRQLPNGLNDVPLTFAWRRNAQDFLARVAAWPVVHFSHRCSA